MTIKRDDPRFDAVLDADGPNFGEKLREAIGLEPGEELEITTPQFNRVDGITPVVSGFKFEELPTYPKATLIALGCGRWDEPDENGEVLWLFPAEWYTLIPEGFEIRDINGKVEHFKKGETDDDQRFGCLAYGFKRKEREDGN